MITRGRILVTRTRPGADRLVQTLKKEGFAADMFPLLTVKYAPPTQIHGDEQALVLTSAHAVPSVPKGCQLPVLCVGRATAIVAKRAGLRVSFSGTGGGALLAQEIIKRLDRMGGPVLWLHAKQSRPELAQILEAAYLTVRHYVAYATVPVTKLSDSVRENLQYGAFSAVLLQSPRTAATFAHLLPKLENPLTAFCFSDNVADALGDVPNLHKKVISTPSDKQLLRALCDEYPGLR